MKSPIYKSLLLTFAFALPVGAFASGCDNGGSASPTAITSTTSTAVVPGAVGTSQVNAGQTPVAPLAVGTGLAAPATGSPIPLHITTKQVPISTPSIVTR